jgi:lipopolysaccharide/colanic/teichoic acid biosynthesis glycosyltransferase
MPIPSTLAERATGVRPRAELGENVVNARHATTVVQDAPSPTYRSGLEMNPVDEASFHHMIALERKRTARSGKPFLLMILEGELGLPAARGGMLGKILSALSLSIRETDVTGWYKEGAAVGVMFTEISGEEREATVGAMIKRIRGTLRKSLEWAEFDQISIAWHAFPEDWQQGTLQGNPALYPDLARRERAQKPFRILKRGMDIAGSGLALLLFSPVMLLVSALVKLSSEGPILYKQQRLGQFGQPFTFLKFRSMYVNNDRDIHREFMKGVISGEHDGKIEGAEDVVYKMTDDPRITRIGKFMRRTSLDELPQFINVLRGDMSLVGPRPPIAYEFEEYDIWHRRRVLEIKPGITGLWQINGRSRVRFDDMVRLDLRYARTWSLWLDICILIQTPAAVLLGDDAY